MKVTFEVTWMSRRGRERYHIEMFIQNQSFIIGKETDDTFEGIPTENQIEIV